MVGSSTHHINVSPDGDKLLVAVKRPKPDRGSWWPCCRKQISTPGVPTRATTRPQTEEKFLEEKKKFWKAKAEEERRLHLGKDDTHDEIELGTRYLHQRSVAGLPQAAQKYTAEADMEVVDIDQVERGGWHWHCHHASSRTYVLYSHMRTADNSA
jgi:hypothetical protein